MSHAPHRRPLRLPRHLRLAWSFGFLLVVGCGDDPVTPKVEPQATPKSADELIAFFETAYLTRNQEAFARLLANDPTHAAEFTFFLAWSPTGESSWRYGEETRIHRRMFTGQPGPGEEEVPSEYRLQAIDISLTKVTDWAEPLGIYSDTNPEGLAREKWKAVEARFWTHVFFDTQTDMDFLVEGEAIFVVIEDLEKSGAEPGRFLLLEWQDIDESVPLGKTSALWGDIKVLYK
jgi:hypothetical protein